MIKMGWKKERGESIVQKKELVLPQKEEGKYRSSQKMTRSWRGGGESVRTEIHARHFPDLPGGEITIECTSCVKHCTTATTKKSPTIKMGLKKERGESIVQK
jgi:hypothetical protein